MTESKTSFHKAIDELAEGIQDLSRRSLQEFSDLDPASIQALGEVWPSIAPERKRTLLEGIQSLAEQDTLVSFDALARSLLTDTDPEVRMRAIRLLDESDDTKLIPPLIKILTDDADASARAEAASALGKYVELGELEEIPDDARRQVEDALLEKANGEDQLLVRRNALESLGFSSRPEVATLIESAYRRENPDWQASALFAMGRSFDERWEEPVLSRMLDENPLIRLAAVEAAGELRLASARTMLFKVLEDEDEDEITSAAIWSLSQVGGEDARVYIENLLDLAEEEEDIDFLEEALDNIEFTDELSRFDLLSIDPDEDE
ncbi:MAG TPA: HEAT repeat domain-containing protein [Anaerolineales bacterium]|nr:HEAT repeat domain-containing protein [Anaerolineales bacterium]